MTHLYTNKNGGYIALMATIIISLVLLIMTTQEGMSGWYTRFTVLGTQSKEQANALAEGCADQALAALVTDVTYTGNTDSTFPAGTCHVYPVEFNTPSSGMVTIKTQAVVQGSYANLALATNLNSVHLGAIPSAPQYGTLIVQTLVTSATGGATPDPSAFTMRVASVNPSKSSFPGASTGVVVTIPTPTASAVNYSVTEDALSGFAPNFTAQCSGAIKGGEIKSCTVSNAPVTTTLTLIANVSNTYGVTTAQPADIPLYIDGTQVTLGHAYTEPAGAHAVTATVPAGYTASAWGYQCTGAAASGTASLDLGNNKICVINLAENPPPAPTCADTVMMLDRTGSMGSTDLADEKSAANALVSLYAAVVPPAPAPRLGVGSFGGLDGSHAWVPTNPPNTVNGILTTVYGDITNAITKITASNSSVGTDLSAAITAGMNELAGHGQAGKQKVLILVSDGDPSEPNGSVTTPLTVAPSTTGTFDQWSANSGAKAAAVAGNDADTSYIATPIQAETFKLQNGTVPAGAVNIAVALHAVARESGGTTGNIALTAENGSAQASDGGHNLSSSYADYSWTMNTNPITGSAWTISEVNTWATSFGVLNASTGATTPRVTQLYATVTWGVAGNSGLKAPGSAHTPNNWSTSAVGNIQTSNNVYASTNNTGTSGEQGYSNFSLAIPTTATITGVEVVAEAKSSDSSGCRIGAELSSNGSSFTNSGNDAGLTGTDASYTLGASNDLWDRTWTPTDFNSTNFTVRLENIDPGSSCTNNSTLSVDQLQVRVSYTTPGSATLAPTAAGTYSAWTPNTGTALAAVASSDADTSYISQAVASTAAQQSFLMGNAAVPNGTSAISVVFHAVAKEVGGSNGAIQMLAEKGGSPVLNTAQNLTSSYADYSWTMNNNPLGGAWTQAEVNSWTTKFGVKDVSTGGASVRVTQLYAVVNYTITTSPTEAALNAADAAKLAGASIFTIYFGSGNPALLAQLASGSTPNGAHQNGSYSDPGGVTAGSVVAAPAATAAPSQFANPTRAFASDNQYATDNTNGHSQGYSGFALNIPPGASINGIEVLTEAKSGDSSGCQFSASLSSNGGSSYTSAMTASITSSSDRSYTLGSATNLWSRTWATSDFDPTKFVVRLQDVDPGNACTNGSLLSIDQVQVRVSYSVNNENGDGDNFFIAPASSDMKGIFQFIGNQVCPAANNPAAAAAPTTASLFVITNVINNNSGANVANDFKVGINGQNASPATFSGTDSPGKQITLDPGTYSITQTTIPSGYTQSMTDSCSGTIAAGEARVCVITDDDLPPPPPDLSITPGSWQEVPGTGQ